MTEPIISGTMIMLRRCVRTGSGFSPLAASRLALRSFLINASGLRFRPRWNLRRVCTRVRHRCLSLPAAAKRGRPAQACSRKQGPMSL